jgi:hypothetical protein
VSEFITGFVLGFIITQAIIWVVLLPRKHERKRRILGRDAKH